MPGNFVVTFRVLEPYAMKVARTVLRRERRGNPPDLSGAHPHDLKVNNMKATDYGQKNPLRCPRCDNYRYLTIKGVRFEEDNKTIGIKIPFYNCENCNTSIPITVFPKPIYDDAITVESYYRQLSKAELKNLKPGENKAIISPFEKKKFKKYSDLNFIYDSQDYYYIPGLFRSWDEGFLCPVFFDKDVLLYYNTHSDYRVIFSSYSRVHILDKEDNSIIRHGFGINRNGKIICWLGDLY